MRARVAHVVVVAPSATLDLLRLAAGDLVAAGVIDDLELRTGDGEIDVSVELARQTATAPGDPPDPSEDTSPSAPLGSGTASDGNASPLETSPSAPAKQS